MDLRSDKGLETWCKSSHPYNEISRASHNIGCRLSNCEGCCAHSPPDGDRLRDIPSLTWSMSGHVFLTTSPLFLLTTPPKRACYKIAIISWCLVFLTVALLSVTLCIVVIIVILRNGINIFICIPYMMEEVSRKNEEVINVKPRRDELYDLIEHSNNVKMLCTSGET